MSEPIPPDFDWKSYAIPIVGPAIVLLVKKLAPRIPNVALVWLAAILGPVLDLLLALLPFYEGNPAFSFALGAAIIGTRELFDQTKQAIAGTGGTPKTAKEFDRNLAAGTITKGGTPVIVTAGGAARIADLKYPNET